MKALFLSFFLLVAITIAAFADEQKFYRNLPPVSETKKLIGSKFNDADAVIILKEIVYGEGKSTYSSWAVYISGKLTTTTTVVIAKVFDQAGIDHFGSFEYEFVDYSDDYDPLKTKPTLTFRARVMKPDSTILVMPDSSISTVDAVSAGKDNPYLKKIIFKIPNLAPDDVVQIEYTHTQRFSGLVRRMFFYHDRYPVLYSNLSIYTAKQNEFDFISFPSDKIGTPMEHEENDAWVYSWTVRNLAAVPDEPFGRTFADVSYLTTIVEKSDEDDGNGWRPKAKNFVKNYISPRSISKSFMKDIGLQPSDVKPTWAEVEKAYTAIRKYFEIASSNSIYPSKNFDKVIEEKKGDASDLALIMMKMLERWDIATTPILIRDRRDGIYEQTVPAFSWFDRLGLIVSLEGGDKVFDFDRSIPSTYEYPWFLHGTTVMALYDTGVSHLNVQLPLKLKDLISKERHFIRMQRNTVNDSVNYHLKAAYAQRVRSQLYDLHGEELTERLKSLVEESSLRTTDTVFINDFRNIPEMHITAVGTSQSSSNSIDSFMIFSPKNDLLRNLRSIFKGTRRHENIRFDEPFCYSLEWAVEIPPDYNPMPVNDPLSYDFESGISSHVAYFAEGNILTITADLIVKSEFLPAEKYRGFIEFLDKTMKAIERDVTFVRKR